MPTWLKWVIGVLVAFIVLSIALYYTNRAFRKKYNISLFGGGLLLLFGVAGLVGGIFLAIGGVTYGYALFIITVITFVITLVYDIKKCGAVGILAFVLQLLFCLPSLLVVFDILFNHGRSTMQASIDESRRERRRERRAARRQNGDDGNND